MPLFNRQKKKIKTDATALPTVAIDPLSESRRDTSIFGVVRRLGWLLVESCANLGVALQFVVQIILRSHIALTHFHLVIEHIRRIGVRSLIIILVASLFIGFVLGLQFYNILDRYGQTEIVGVGVAITLFRELGPVTTALLFVGCACSAMTASIGLKKSSEQIAAMEVMAVDPIAHELSPRFWATVISLPLLTFYFNAVGIFGSYMIAVVLIGIDNGIFWSEMQDRVLFHPDFTGGALKSVVFAVSVGLISLYEGYFCTPTSSGVARATTNTVVKGSLSILGLNFILTAFMVD